MKDSHEHISQLAVERFLLGEMSEGERSELLASAEGCERCAARIVATREDEAAFALRAVPPDIRRMWSAEPRRSWTGRALALLVPVAAAAAIALVFLLPGVGPEGDEGQDEVLGIGQRAGDGLTALKGSGVGRPGIDLGFYLLEGDLSVMGKPGQILTQGDRIQFWYHVPERTRGVLVGIDGSGAVTAYVPRDEGQPGILEEGSGHVVDLSVVLDDAIGPERFFLCVGLDEGKGVEEVKRAAYSLVERGADIREVERLPIECDQASVWISKE